MQSQRVVRGIARPGRQRGTTASVREGFSKVGYSGLRKASSIERHAVQIRVSAYPGGSMRHIMYDLTADYRQSVVRCCTDNAKISTTVRYHNGLFYNTFGKSFDVCL